MSGARIGALAARIVRGFRRDPRSMALIVIVPLVVMALIGYLISDQREPLRIGFASGDAARGVRGDRGRPRGVPGGTGATARGAARHRHDL